MNVKFSITKLNHVSTFLKMFIKIFVVPSILTCLRASNGELVIGYGSSLSFIDLMMMRKYISSIYTFHAFGFILSPLDVNSTNCVYIVERCKATCVTNHIRHNCEE